MANTDKNILITPNTNTSNYPKIDFTGFDNAPLTLDVQDPGSLRFTSAQGTLFYMSPEAEGDVFKVANVVGIPIFKVNNSFQAETVCLVPHGNTGKVGIGTENPSANKLQINGILRNQYANVTPSIENCVLAIANFPGSEGTNYHATMQFNVNGGTHNRVGSLTFGAESSGNRNGYFAFCVDDANTRPEVARLTASKRLGVGTASPSGTIHAGGDEGSIYFDKQIYSSQENNLDGGTVGNISTSDRYTRLGAQYFIKSFATYFPHNVANRALKIYLNQTNHWGGGEIILSGTYSYQNMSGFLKYYWTRNSNGASNYNTAFTTAVSLGSTENNFRVEEIGYDSTAARPYIIVQHRVSTGNSLYVTVTGIGSGPRNYSGAYNNMYAEMITRTPNP